MRRVTHGEALEGEDPEAQWWRGGQGFRFGVVGFGSQFRPAETDSEGNPTSVLAVRGLDKSGIFQLMTDKGIDVAAWGPGRTRTTAVAGLVTLAIVENSITRRRYRLIHQFPVNGANLRTPNTPLWHWCQKVLDFENRWDTLDGEGQNPSTSFKINGVQYANFGTDTLTQSLELAGFKANGTYTTGSAPVLDEEGLTRSSMITSSMRSTTPRPLTATSSNSPAV
ncbi:hypothetical protein BBOU_1555 [Bifidobacterium boum]|uniref:Uncharacterized protein n=1 Tax=Bifidobacterium boum TaxID=78343 RepID=A0A086ZIW3_9BIFI|nr:hypothetical protein BBOU_1555 [Bifidobacterium boum]